MQLQSPQFSLLSARSTSSSIMHLSLQNLGSESCIRISSIYTLMILFFVQQENIIQARFYIFNSLETQMIWISTPKPLSLATILENHQLYTNHIIEQLLLQ